MSAVNIVVNGFTSHVATGGGEDAGGGGEATHERGNFCLVIHGRVASITLGMSISELPTARLPHWYTRGADLSVWTCALARAPACRERRNSLSSAARGMESLVS